MKWQIEDTGHKSLVQLPDFIPSRQVIEVTVDGSSYWVQWDSQLEVLSFVDPKTQVETNYSLRSHDLSCFIDDPAMEIGLETRTPGDPYTKAVATKAQLFFPGIDALAARTAASGQKVRSPITGKVLKVFAVKGQKVEKGQVLCVIEAMKMENSISAPCPGVIGDVEVEEGAQIKTGGFITSIEPE